MQIATKAIYLARFIDEIVNHIAIGVCRLSVGAGAALTKTSPQPQHVIYGFIDCWERKGSVGKGREGWRREG